MQISDPNNHGVLLLSDPGPRASYARDGVTKGVLGGGFGKQLVRSNFWERLRSTGALHGMYDSWDGGGRVSDMVKVNPRLRVLRYDADNGDDFRPHFDAVTEDREGRLGKVGPGWVWRSYLTVLLYLNSGFTGGETVFKQTSGGGEGKVTPRTGWACVFEHDLWHEGRKLADGVKYILRTDVMFLVREGVGGEGKVEGDGGDDKQGEEPSVGELLIERGFKEEDVDILKGMGMPGTVEAFKGPGREVLGEILKEGGMEGWERVLEIVFDEGEKGGE